MVFVSFCPGLIIEVSDDDESWPRKKDSNLLEPRLVLRRYPVAAPSVTHKGARWYFSFRDGLHGDMVRKLSLLLVATEPFGEALSGFKTHDLMIWQRALYFDDFCGRGALDTKWEGDFSQLFALQPNPVLAFGLYSLACGEVTPPIEFVPDWSTSEDGPWGEKDSQTAKDWLLSRAQEFEDPTYREANWRVAMRIMHGQSLTHLPWWWDSWPRFETAFGQLDAAKVVESKGC